VPSTRLRLDPKELRGAAARVRAEFGPGARIVSADEIRIGGIGGFFARRVYELVIDYPEAVPRTEELRSAASTANPRMSGIAALLEQADRDESFLPGVAGAGSVQGVSTQSDDFSSILGALAVQVDAPVATAPPDPVVFRPEPGGLLAIAGLRDDALRVALDLAGRTPGAQLGVAGDLGGTLPRVEDRREAVALRARGVEADAIAIVAIGLGSGGPIAEANASRVPLIGADAVWVAVDATRKPEDTARWVAAVVAAAPVREMAVLDAPLTETPESVHDLGLRQAWPTAGH
jgi:hypothetical protein